MIITCELRKHRRLRRRDLALAVLTPIALLVVRQILATTGAIDDRLFPAPSRIAAKGVDLLQTGVLLHDTGATVQRLVIGYVIGSVFGVLAGLLMGSWRSAIGERGAVTDFRRALRITQDRDSSVAVAHLRSR